MKVTFILNVASAVMQCILCMWRPHAAIAKEQKDLLDSPHQKDALLQSNSSSSTIIGDDECPIEFFLNPKNTDRITFLKQFKPCGFYSQCKHKFDDWFGPQHTLYNTIEPNSCYPETGSSYGLDQEYGIHLVQFDTGLDPVTYHAYQQMEDWDLIADTNLTTEGTSSWLDPFAENFTTHTMPLQETCVETLVRYPDDWGNIPNTFSFYNCMGRCGSSCAGAWAGWDCLKHDVCSYFKGLAMETPVVGFCRDFDCGDETAQSVVNCWSRSSTSGATANEDDTPVICSSDSDMVLNPAARLRGQKRACTLRTKWERNQGMPWAKGTTGESCSSPDDCISGNCSKWNIFNRKCLP